MALTHSRPVFFGYFVCVCCCLIHSMAHADVKNSRGGFLDFNAYPYLLDVDNDTIVTLNIGAKLPNRFSYFSLTNLGKQSQSGALGDTVTYYTEQNLRWKITKTSPIDLAIQLNFRTGDDNDRHRLGIRWCLSDTQGIAPFFKRANIAYSVTVYGVQFDHEDSYVWQMEHVFKVKFPYVSDRMYLSGFVDHTFNQNLAAGFPNSPIVAEASWGFVSSRIVTPSPNIVLMNIAVRTVIIWQQALSI